MLTNVNEKPDTRRTAGINVINNKSTAPDIISNVIELPHEAKKRQILN